MSASGKAADRPATREDLECVYIIGGKEQLPEIATQAVLGFKAYNLARMSALGLNVPPAFVLGTGYCTYPQAVGQQLWRPALVKLEALTGLKLGDARRPLLLSVRSGAPVSMPGMMDTLLNIGLTDATVPGLIRLTGHPRLAWDAYRRLIAGYGEVVAGIDAAHFEADLAAVRQGEDEGALDFASLRQIARRHLETFQRETGSPFPQSAEVQLSEAISAVLRSWGSEKAVAYRNLHGLSHDMGTAVTVQRMVFGNAGGLSGAGVGFTRNPSTGDPNPWVDFLFNAQGEDVVSGRRTARGHEELAAVAPRVWDELVDAAALLERHFGDMQDFEFTVQEGVLFLLQTRAGKRTPFAAARIALDLLAEGLIDAGTARERTRVLDRQALTVLTIAAGDGAALSPIASASSAANGVVCGEIGLEETRVRERKAAGASVILVRRDAETSDIAALALADGLLTQHGARTSHAAVVARQLGKVCLVGSETMTIDDTRREVAFGGTVFPEGATLTLDGNSGKIYSGAAHIAETVPVELLARLDALHGRLTQLVSSPESAIVA
ncbi:PEP/pyruvate-binding domain-containing protein [Mesorhizobium sp. M00.F.Ca.ET.216.01.1.1]|uniref:PEP/pyruvate-binding domain-containing protein n=1 Tax=Mesorhizobium sp. M00.F.Ca.ET.216.01.1.1 TaxID=2500528 RepID=UPI000FDB0CCF|nr:PEP/pyruvate-binding domain-containing protein [Mesorhizobium sp. M00.F.Ca.ET.216.01.1.1]TGQ32427.1 pyruvate, phosphate dikinase [Mesorhizobium sp. M00.F.Ca.ET.216.01.1.1]TJW15593.1 MAG: pyruvate, phosphate dikinase [Mesorhizobium sp.]